MFAGKYDQFATEVGEIKRAFVTGSFLAGQVLDLGRPGPRIQLRLPSWGEDGGIGPIWGSWSSRT